ncbi:YtxH domain-containing protein [Botryobacter ruber]|uniref:YtxH domain-containing protein n=1 Tax=Botryobacter ruber TaxID=2171629 RepID=UPI0013E30FE0|nr:YtxH domain-containing protein [Botryobacter ruber]
MHSDASEGSSGSGKLAVGLLAGASVGILAGMLLAPERGREMRKQIANSAAKVGDQMNKAMATYKDKMNSWTGRRAHEAPPSNQELNGPANRSTTAGSGTVDKHVL